MRKSRRLVSLSLAIGALCVVGGCASTSNFESVSGPGTANLRVATALPGNTLVGALSKPDSCDAEDVQTMGWFHPGGGQSFQAARRRFDQRVGMDYPSKFPPHMYAEYRVPASRPHRLSALSVMAGANPYDPNQCSAVTDVAFEAGKSYELVVVRDRDSCGFALFELPSAPQGQAKNVSSLLKQVCKK